MKPRSLLKKFLRSMEGNYERGFLRSSSVISLRKMGDDNGMSCLCHCHHHQKLFWVSSVPITSSSLAVWGHSSFSPLPTTDSELDLGNPTGGYRGDKARPSECQRRKEIKHISCQIHRPLSGVTKTSLFTTSALSTSFCQPPLSRGWAPECHR